MKKFISALLCLIMIFSLCSCTTNNNTILTMGIMEQVDSFNPTLSKTDVEKLLSTNCFEGLLRFNEEGSLSLAGATSYTVDKNALTYTFKLNPDAKFFVNSSIKATIEGLGIETLDNKITAQDYAYSIESYTSAYPESFPLIKNVVATDDITLKITLKGVDNDFLYKLASYPIYPVRKIFCEKAGKIYGTTPSTILTNGPYYIKSSSESETIIERSKEYNGNIQVKNKQITFYTTGKPENLEERFLNGSYDIINTDKIKTTNETFSTYSSVTETWGLMFNCKNPIGAQKKLRTALLLSLNYKELPAPDFAAIKSYSIIPNGFIVGDKPYSSFATEEHDISIDIQSAKKSIDNYLKKENAESLKLSFFVPNEYISGANMIKEQWVKIFGEKISVEITQYSLNDTQSVIDKNEFDIAVLPLKSKNNTAYSLLEGFSNPPFNYENKIFNSIMKNISPIITEAYTELNKAQEHIIKNGIFAPLFFVNDYLYVNNGITNIYMADGGNKIYLFGGTKA